MPYTLSHAVVALPVSVISRGKVPFAAMVVGSMSPDFPYLLALSPTEAPGHSEIGVLIYCLLPSLLMLLVWYRWIEGPTLELFRLPQREWSFGRSSYFLVVIGVLVGAYSHVLWDATSHVDGAFVVNSEFWNREVLSLPMYKLNQYGSGILGLIALFVWYVLAVCKNRQDKYQGRLVAGVLIYSINIAFFVSLANIVHGSTVIIEYAVRSAIGGIAGGICGMCMYALITHIQTR
jgi:multisubunit Na+/H+ antiporter MnhF subunit